MLLENILLVKLGADRNHQPIGIDHRCWLARSNRLPLCFYLQMEDGSPVLKPETITNACTQYLLCIFSNFVFITCIIIILAVRHLHCNIKYKHKQKSPKLSGKGENSAKKAQSFSAGCTSPMLCHCCPWRHFVSIWNTKSSTTRVVYRASARILYRGPFTCFTVHFDSNP